MCSAKCSLSLVQIKFSLTAFNAKARVHSSLAHSPQLVSCREWLGRKLGQSRRRVGVGIVGIARSQVGAASGTEEEHKISYEELGRYGIDESDYADSMRAQVSDEHQTSSSKAVSKSKTQKRKAPYEVVDKTKDDPEDSEDMEFTDDAEVEGNDWCTYLILSNDKLKTYLGVTANLTRRFVLFFHLFRNVCCLDMSFMLTTWLKVGDVVYHLGVAYNIHRVAFRIDMT